MAFNRFLSSCVIIIFCVLVIRVHSQPIVVEDHFEEVNWTKEFISHNDVIGPINNPSTNSEVGDQKSLFRTGFKNFYWGAPFPRVGR